MGELTFIHCGDIHLDARFTSTGLTDNKAKQRRQELKDAFSRIIDEVIRNQAALLLISGDLFEHEYVSKSTIDFVINQLNRIPDVRVFISPGNHDPYVANSYYATVQWPGNVHIFGNQMERVYVPEYNVCIDGVAFSGKTQYYSMLVPRDNIDSGKDASKPCTILLVHGTLDGVGQECAYHPITTKELQQYGYDYVALGHYHKKALDGNNKVAYCGSPEPLGFDEPGEHGIIIGRVTEHRVHIRFQPIHQRQWVTIEADITGMTTTEEVEQKIMAVLEGHEQNLVKLILTGRKRHELELNIDLVTSRVQDNCFYINLTDNTIPDYHLEELCRLQNLKGIFVKKMLEQIESTEEKSQKDKLYQALYLGLDALNS